MVWKNMYLCNPKSSARMVKLVDTLVSGTSGRKAVQVRVLFRALKKVGGFPRALKKMPSSKVAEI